MVILAPRKTAWCLVDMPPCIFLNNRLVDRREENDMETYNLEAEIKKKKMLAELEELKGRSHLFAPSCPCTS